MNFEEFDWDEAKRLSNLENHEIDFAGVPPIFDSPCVIREDKRRDYGEIRMIVLGELRGEICYVVYTVREETCRLISARRANERERKKYREIIAAEKKLPPADEKRL
ncbi:BrnT family toxin [Pannus brasiliensis CCIBt3594]|uniref:BrnT family toxin n=1 Tax=Pannus brasiliensis CCIBt3594 TaxID=1427578 RepID=A0AAW9QZD6_9CHRO